MASSRPFQGGALAALRARCEIFRRVTNALEGEVLRQLRDAGPRSKAQLAESLGVPRTTLTAVLRNLVAAGHIEDGPLAPSSGGRRSVTVRVAATRWFLVVSVAERRIRVAALDGHLVVVAKASLNLQERGREGDSVPDAVLRATDEVLAGRVPVAIGLATADPDSPLIPVLSDRLSDDYAGIPVAALRAVNAMALGERRAGATRAIDDFVAVRLGRSVTASTMSGGVLAAGAAGRSGEMGHLRVEEFGPACLCGRTGCLDAFISSEALVVQAVDLAHGGRSETLQRALANSGTLDLSDIVAAARAGDALVVQLARNVGQRLGRVVAGLVAHADPRVVVIGGPVAALGMHLLGDLRATVYRVAPAALTQGLDVVLSELGEQAVLIGAGCGAFEAWSQNVGAGD